jgi:hypothetical protein
VTDDEMQAHGCYAAQDQTWVRDPDGNEWEVFLVRKDNLPEELAEPEAGTGCAADCSRPGAEPSIRR